MLSILVPALVFGLLSHASPIASPIASPVASTNTTKVVRRSFDGPATHYVGNIDGACQMNGYTIPEGLYGTALASQMWDNSYSCGGCVAITNPANGVSIRAMIVDECMTCSDNQLDLFPDGFAALNAVDGDIPITWDFVNCYPSVTGPLQIHLEPGVSQYWFSAQVRNAGRRTANMEISSDGGATWMPTTRSSYDYFVIESGAGEGVESVQVRVTSHMGTVVTVPDVPIYSESSTEATANYE